MTTANPAAKPQLTVKYPFVTEEGKEFSDLEKLLTDLGQQSGGYYLLGANNCWHGGIHITDEKFAHHNKTHPVRCMMDGVVIAYRLNKNYPTQKWQAKSTLPVADLKFSNGFCLIKHDYESPANQTEGENKGKTNKLTFYSLYMHLADYQTYVPDSTSQEKTVSITKDTNARDTANINHNIGALTSGSTVKVDTQQQPHKAKIKGKTYSYYRGSVVSKAEGSADVVTVGASVYLYSGCFPAGTFSLSEKPTSPGYWKATVTGKSKEPMAVYSTEQACKEHQKNAIARLNPEQTVTFHSEQITNATINGKSLKIALCEFPATSTFGHGPETNLKNGWMIVDESQVSWENVEPTDFDQIVKLSKPLPISAGDPIGFMGIWESPADPIITGTTKTKYQMHVELFTTDNKAVLDQFLNNDAKLTNGKKYLKVPKGTQLYASNGHGNYVYVHDSLFAARDYVFSESDCTQVKDTAGTTFYQLKQIRTGEAALGPVDLYSVKIEGNVKLVTQYDWKELGFNTLEETNDDADGYIDPDKIPSVLFKDIFKRVDSINSRNGQGDGILTGKEIQAALQQDKDLRNDLYKMIAGHPSEWHSITQNNIKKRYEEIKMENTEEEYKNAIQFEIDRFLKCEFVSQIDGLTQKLWHFHPIVLSKFISERAHPKTPIDGSLTPIDFLFFYNGDVIDESDYVEAAEILGCEVAAIKAVSKTETGSSGSYFKFQGDDDYVPSILFERHHFHNHTNGIYDKYDDISNKEPGGYGIHRDQYSKLMKAYKLDKRAALMSASWGKFQILASNYIAAGYANPEDFVQAISLSEKNQLKAFICFIQHDNVLLQSLRNKDWLKFAKAYNGPKQKGYDLRMKENYNESL